MRRTLSPARARLNVTWVRSLINIEMSFVSVVKDFPLSCSYKREKQENFSLLFFVYFLPCLTSLLLMPFFVARLLFLMPFVRCRTMGRLKVRSERFTRRSLMMSNVLFAPKCKRSAIEKAENFLKVERSEIYPGDVARRVSRGRIERKSKVPFTQRETLSSRASSVAQESCLKCDSNIVFMFGYISNIVTYVIPEKSFVQHQNAIAVGSILLLLPRLFIFTAFENFLVFLAFSFVKRLAENSS